MEPLSLSGVKCLKPARPGCVLIVGISLACVQARPPTDTGAIGITTASTSGPSVVATPAGTPAPGTATPTPTAAPAASTGLAYTPDLIPVFASDCLVCHSDRNALGRYSMSSYAAVMRAVTPGSASSTLVRVTQPNGSMYRYWTGNRAAKATLTRDWVVTYRAAQTR